MYAESRLLKDWYPLDHTPLPDYVPPYWDGPHVGKRMAEAFRTLRLLPAPRGPQAFGNSWPEYAIEWQDAVAQAEQDAAQREAEQRAQNYVRIMPSAAEIWHMEQGIGWPARYLRDRPQYLRTVLIVAQARSIGLHIEWCARRRLHIPHRLARRWNREGLDTIAAGLRRDRIMIF